ncbi:MAG: DegV family protein [Lachnospiraceae bacterium]|nr:DegV family protein [Lachnospiraceae bacterium]
MRDFVITTESNSDLPISYIRENNIGVIPHYYQVEDRVYGDGVELSYKEFYDQMRKKKSVSTMPSNPIVIERIFREYAEEGKDVLHISFSSALSPGFENVQTTAEKVMKEHPEMNILVIDTLSASLAEALVIMKAVELKKEGCSMEDTAKILGEFIPHCCVLFTVDDLNHLYRGGRLSKTTAVVGTLANIKPILYIDDDGKLVSLSKSIGRVKSLQMLADLMGEHLGEYKDEQITIGIIHGDCEADALYLQNYIKEKYGYEDFMIQPIGPSIGAHSGPGTVALAFLGEKR